MQSSAPPGSKKMTEESQTRTLQRLALSRLHLSWPGALHLVRVTSMNKHRWMPSDPDFPGSWRHLGPPRHSPWLPTWLSMSLQTDRCEHQGIVASLVPRFPGFAKQYIFLQTVDYDHTRGFFSRQQARRDLLNLTTSAGGESINMSTTQLSTTSSLGALRCVHPDQRSKVDFSIVPLRTQA